MDAAGKRYSTVLTDVETPYIEEDRVMLYKLHGCVTRPDTLVLTRKDHALLNRRLTAYLSVLRYLFVTRPLLFLAYNLDDPLFETIFHEVTASVEGHRRRAYAAWPGAPTAWREIWLREERRRLSASRRRPVRPRPTPKCASSSACARISCRRWTRPGL